MQTEPSLREIHGRLTRAAAVTGAGLSETGAIDQLRGASTPDARVPATLGVA